MSYPSSKYQVAFVTLNVIVLVYFFFSLNNSKIEIHLEKECNQTHLNVPRSYHSKRQINVAFVCCGTMFESMVNMLKSALIFSRTNIHFIAFVDKGTFVKVENVLNGWKNFSDFTFQMLPTQFPTNTSENWERLYRPCSTQRLFIPNELKNVDSLIYVDVDIIFMASVEEIWNYFSGMSNEQVAAIASEDTNWYHKPDSNLPYYGVSGLNSGVMLMNLTRMREFNWYDHVMTAYKNHKTNMKLHDQDIINVIFHKYPEKLYLLPCNLNFRFIYCPKLKEKCKRAFDEKVVIVHGNAFSFQHFGAVRAIYKTFNGFTLGDDIYKLYQYLKSNITAPNAITCSWDLPKKILEQFELFMKTKLGKD